MSGKRGQMTIGGSLLLIAIGAILRFAVTARVAGVNLATVGTILMVVGAAGLVISLVWLASTRRRTAVVGDRTYAAPPVAAPGPYTERVPERRGYEDPPALSRAPA